MAGAVPETVLKKRKRDEEWATKKAVQQAEAKTKARTARKEIFKRAEQYVKEYREKVGAWPAPRCMRGPGEQAAAGVERDARVSCLSALLLLQKVNRNTQHIEEWCSGASGKGRAEAGWRLLPVAQCLRLYYLIWRLCCRAASGQACSRELKGLTSSEDLPQTRSLCA